MGGIDLERNKHPTPRDRGKRERTQDVVKLFDQDRRRCFRLKIVPDAVSCCGIASRAKNHA